MKILTLIIHTSAQQDVADRLRAMPQVADFSFSRVEGHGVQLENDPLLSARDKVVGYTPRVRGDLLLEDAHVELVLSQLSQTGSDGTSSYLAGQCVYWVTAVERCGQL